MKTRLINAAIFLGIYLVFLAWYDGWGIDPITPEEVDTLVANVVAQGANPEQLKNFRKMAQDDDGEEFFMLNLNRYAYAEGEVPQGVPAAYTEYGQAVIQMLLKNAGHPIYSGTIPEYLVAGEPKGEPWHEIILVRYRSRRDFISMVTSAEYQEIAQHRSGGIQHAEVTPTTASINLVTPRFVMLTLLVILAWMFDRLFRRAR